MLLDASSPSLAILTALPKEHAAVSRLMLDSSVLSLEEDATLYRVGSIPGATGVHRVVLACLPKYGNNTAGITTTNIVRSFPSVKDVLMVGICAGVPRPDRPQAHVRLGDVVVSSGAGVAQFDLGAVKANAFEYRATPPPPSARLLQAVNLLESELLLQPDLWPTTLSNFLSQAGVVRPKREPPHPFRHPRDRDRRAGFPRIFRGIIGASNALIKNAEHRDEIAKRHNLLAIEMEGSGVADATWDAGLGYLLVRGVCDYGDEQKDDSWQEYAAHVAAGYAETLLLTIPGAVHDSESSDDYASMAPAHVPDEKIRSLFAGLGGFTPDIAITKGADTGPRNIGPESTVPASELAIHLSASRLTVTCWASEDLVACGGFEDRIYWVDLASGALWSTKGTGAKLRAMILMGDVLVCADDSGQVAIIAPDHEASHIICRSNSPIYSLAYHPEGRRLYTGDRSGRITEWAVQREPHRAQRLSVVEQLPAPVFSLVERNGFLFAGDGSGSFLERDLRTRRATSTQVSTSALFAVDASNDLGTVVAGSSDGTLHSLSPRRVSVPLHDDAVRAIALAGNWALTSSKDGSVKAHNIATGSTTVIWTWRDYGYGVALSPSTKRFAMVSGGGELAVLDFPKPLGEMNLQDVEIMRRIND